MPPRIHPIPEVDQPFNQWTVQVPGPRTSVCKCTCGIVQTVNNSHLRDGSSKQCRECWSIDKGFSLKVRNAVNHAIERCTDTNHPRYEDWGGRGITVYDAWLQNPVLFKTYIAGLPGATDVDLMLDRIDNDGPYAPGNLRWITSTESNSNQREKRRRRFTS